MTETETTKKQVNILLDEDVHRQLKVRAAEEGKTIRDLVLEYLQAGLEGEKC